HDHRDRAPRRRPVRLLPRHHVARPAPARRAGRESCDGSRPGSAEGGVRPAGRLLPQRLRDEQEPAAGTPAELEEGGREVAQGRADQQGTVTSAWNSSGRGLELERTSRTRVKRARGEGGMRERATGGGGSRGGGEKGSMNGTRSPRPKDEPGARSAFGGDGYDSQQNRGRPPNARFRSSTFFSSALSLPFQTVARRRETLLPAAPSHGPRTTSTFLLRRRRCTDPGCS